MADSERSQIVRVKLKLETEFLTDRVFDDFFWAFEESATSTAHDVFGSGYVAKVQAREGSIILTVTILGSIGAGILGTQKFLVDYPKMKEGLSVLVDDSKRFGEKIKTRFLSKKPAPAQLTSAQTQPLAPAEILEFLDAEVEVPDDIPMDRARRERRALAQLNKLRTHLSTPDKEALIRLLEQKNVQEMDVVRTVLYEGRRDEGSWVGNEVELYQKALPRPQRRKRSKSKTIHL